MLKMLSGSCPIIAHSNHTTFSQNQTDATVPLSWCRVQVARRKQVQSNHQVHAQACPGGHHEEQTLEEEAEATQDDNEGDAPPLPHQRLLPEESLEQVGEPTMRRIDQLIERGTLALRPNVLEGP